MTILLPTMAQPLTPDCIWFTLLLVVALALVHSLGSPSAGQSVRQMLGFCGEENRWITAPHVAFLDGRVQTVNRVDSWRYGAPDGQHLSILNNG
jgi:hypothetical protein